MNNFLELLPSDTFRVSTADSKESAGLLYRIIEYLFWISLIVYTNPGNFMESRYIDAYYIAGKINFRDVFFVLLSVCYLVIPKGTYSDTEYLKIKTFLLCFLAYYFIVFAFIVPLFNGIKDYTLLTSLVKSRYTLYSICLFFYIYEFFKRSWDAFFKLLLYSSIIVLLLFVQGQITKIEILPVFTQNRNFVDIDRILLMSPGFMHLLVPFATVILVFNLKIKYKYLVLAGFVLISISYMLSVTRRDMFAIIIYFILAILLSAYIKRNLSIILNKSVKIFMLVLLVLIVAYAAFPRYVNAAGKAIEETITVVKENRDSSGDEDVRMTFNRPFINNLFYKYPVLGTGFDNRWRNKEGDNQGFEAADYPFLAALAMFGIVGVLLFLPVYFIIFRILRKDLRYLRGYEHKGNIMIFLFMISFVMYTIFDLMQYINYFFPLSNSSEYIWFAMLALYLASRQLFYRSAQNSEKTIQPV